MFAEKLRTNYFRTSNDNAKAWCKRNFLNYKGMVEANELVDEIRMRLKNIGVFEVASQDKQSWEERYLPTVRKVISVLGYPIKVPCTFHNFSSVVIFLNFEMHLNLSHSK